MHIHTNDWYTKILFFVLRIATMVSKLLIRELTYIHKADEALFGTLQTFNLLLQSTHLGILISNGCMQGLKPPHNFLEPLNLRGKYVAFNLNLLNNVKLDGNCKYSLEQQAQHLLHDALHAYHWMICPKTRTLTSSSGWFMLCFICYSYKSQRNSWWVLSKLTLVRVTRKSLRSRPSSKLWLQHMFCLSIKRLFKPTNSQSQESLNRHPLLPWPLKSPQRPISTQFLHLNSLT